MERPLGYSHAERQITKRHTFISVSLAEQSSPELRIGRMKWSAMYFSGRWARIQEPWSQGGGVSEKGAIPDFETLQACYDIHTDAVMSDTRIDGLRT